MFLDYGLQVVCAAITNFCIVFAENLVEAVIYSKMFAECLIRSPQKLMHVAKITHDDK